MSYNNDYDTAKTIEDKNKLSASNYFKQTVLLCRLWLQRQVSEDEIAERLRPMLDSVCVEYTDKMIDAVMVFVYIAIGVGTALSVYHHVLGGIL